MSDYVPYKIRVEKAERWVDRPIKVSFVTPTPAGSNSSVIYLDESERAELVRQLSAPTPKENSHEPTRDVGAGTLRAVHRAGDGRVQR